MTFYLTTSDRDKAEYIDKNLTKGVNLKWFEHLDKDKKEEFAKLLKNSSQVLDTLKGILVKEFELHLTSKKSDFNSPNWALERANSDGYLRAIQNFINLLTIKG